MNAMAIETEVGRLVMRVAEWMVVHDGNWHSLILSASEAADGSFAGRAVMEATTDLSAGIPRTLCLGEHNNPGEAIYTALVALANELKLDEVFSA